MLRRHSARRDEDRSDARRILIVGLGNPGDKYARTRHNVGTDCVELLASRAGARLKAGRDRALVAETRLESEQVVLAVPTTYMNESGAAVGALARRYRIEDPSRIVIVHDELDLEPGVVRVKQGGGLAGHNGLKSVSSHLRTDDYVRVRIGVGKPRSKEHGADHVLGRVSSVDRKVLDAAIETASDAVQMLVRDSVAAAMQEYNSR